MNSAPLLSLLVKCVTGNVFKSFIQNYIKAL